MVVQKAALWSFRNLYKKSDNQSREKNNIQQTTSPNTYLLELYLKAFKPASLLVRIIPFVTRKIVIDDNNSILNWINGDRIL
jgi:hypothetical protein